MKIKVLKVEPKKEPEVIEIEDTLKNLQELVGGYIEYVFPFNDDVAIIDNEEGKLIGLEPNRRLQDDVLVGTFLIVGVTDDGENTSLTDEQIKIYTDRFMEPEDFGEDFDVDDYMDFKII